jgi:outer membrane biosynthesis protein TonB
VEVGMKSLRRNSPRHTARSRDAALRRLRRVNRWLIAGSALLTGLFAELAASAFSGHPASARASSARSKTHHTATKPLAPPQQPPRAAETTPAPEAEREAPAEPQTPSEPVAPAQETAPEPAPEKHESEAPPAPEPAPPVVSGGS